MKRYLIFAIAVLLPVLAGAQAKIQTKKYVLSDFSEKTMKVVLTGNEMTDAMIRSTVHEIWHAGPYEFCSQEEFEQCKKSSDYYFLAISESSFGKKNNKTAGIKSFTVFKGKETATEGFEGLYKVVSVPFCQAENPDGRQIAFVAPMLYVLQEEILKMMKRPINFTSGIVVSPQMLKGKWNKTILVDKQDIPFELGFSMEEIYKKENIFCTDSEDIAKAISERRKDTIVCYVVGPAYPSKNAVSYTLLFDATSYELIYMKNHSITTQTPKGVLQSEFRYFINCN